jgi:hypothetical protein
MEQHLVSFLLRAKKSTYAAHGAEAPSSRPNSHDLRYAEGDLLYIDTYLGGLSFAGEEAIWVDGVPVWTMNYCGRVLDHRFNGDFLKRALLLVPEESPFRGPESYVEQNMAFSCRADGNTDWFQGYEEIRIENQRVYECFYHGGIIQS